LNPYERNGRKDNVMKAMYRYSILSLAALAAMLVALQASAHHSYAATYDPDRLVTIEGQLVSFTLRNPHSMVYILAPDESGATQRWAVEWGAANVLRSDGIEGDSLKAGDHVIVTGVPGRQASAHRMLMRSVERPADGWSWDGSFN
jgi:hypothetical protein